MLKTKTIGKLRREPDNSDEESLFGEDHLDGGLLSRAKNSPHIRSMFKNLIIERCSEMFNNLQALPRLHMARKGNKRALNPVGVFVGKESLLSGLVLRELDFAGHQSFLLLLLGPMPPSGRRT